MDLKYFVLKPRSKGPADPYAVASRNAMLAYADTIRPVNPELAMELERWVRKERDRAADLGAELYQPSASRP